MPKLLHDQGNGPAIRARVEKLNATMTPLWGKMSIDQMVHHVNLSIAESLGEYKAERSVRGTPKSWVRWMILNGPWGRGAPTRKDMYIAQGQRYDFAQEKASTLSMLDRILAKSMEVAGRRARTFR